MLSQLLQFATHEILPGRSPGDLLASRQNLQICARVAKLICSEYIGHVNDGIKDIRSADLPPKTDPQVMLE
jgi:hypothetical protein